MMKARPEGEIVVSKEAQEEAVYFRFFFKVSAAVSEISRSELAIQQLVKVGVNIRVQKHILPDRNIPQFESLNVGRSSVGT